MIKSLLVLMSCFVTINAFAQELIKLGFVGPLSGEAASYGLDERNATEMAISEINTSGILGTTKLAVIYEDGKCSGKDATIATQKLVNVDKVKVILGGACSGETLGAAPIAERAGVVLFSAFSSNPEITRAGDFVFRTAPSDSEGGKLAAKLAAEHAGLSNVAIITENTEYAIGFRKAFVEAIASHGLKLVAEETYNPTDVDLRSILLRLKAKGPQILLLNPNNGQKGGLLIKQLADIRWRPVLIGTFAFSSEEAALAAGGIDRMEGLRFADGPEVESEEGRRFIERFRKQYSGPQSSMEAALRYDSVHILAGAIKSVGYDAAKIRDYLYAMPPYSGMAGTYSFDRNGDVVGVSYVAKVVRKGKIEVLKRD